MTKTVTIYDIAVKCNTSTATVSRVLSNSGYPVNPVLSRKIKKAAREMNYIPNMLGRQLSTKNSTSIGVIIPSISNPFYSEIVLGIEETAREQGYRVLLCNSHQSPQLENEYLQTLFENQIKGLIISSISSEESMLKHYIKNGLKVVAIDQTLDVPGINQIHFDHEKGGYMATASLLEKGHRNIAYVTAPLDRPSRVGIHNGYLRAMKEWSIEPNQAWIQITPNDQTEKYQGDFEFLNGQQLTRNLLAQTELPTAIFACNDMTAVGVLNELTCQGIKVPEDISVMGFDNIEIGKMVHPSLTTMEQPKYQMGQFASKILLDWLNGNTLDLNEIVLQTKLIERNSVCRKGGR